MDEKWDGLGLEVLGVTDLVKIFGQLLRGPLQVVGGEVVPNVVIVFLRHGAKCMSLTYTEPWSFWPLRYEMMSFWEFEKKEKKLTAVPENVDERKALR